MFASVQKAFGYDSLGSVESLRVQTNSRVVAILDQVSCDVAGETAILSLRTGVYYGLNAVGTRVWNLIQEPANVKDVLVVLLDEFEVEPARCETDLIKVLGDLASHGLIEEA